MKGDITKIYGVDLVGSKDPNALVRTDDAVGLNITVGVSEITSDFDNCYPWSDIEEVTDDAGNVFVKIPKFYSKITKNSDGTYLHQLSGVRYKGFDTLFKYGERDIDYVLVGKYEGSGQYRTNGTVSKVCSRSGQTPLKDIKMDTFRDLCKANGTGYQQYDFLIDLIIKELWLVEMATTNCQSIMRGNTRFSRPLNTGATDEVQTPSGSPVSNTDGKHACKYRGIENPWGNYDIFCDGISFSNKSVYICTNPAFYIAGRTTSPYMLCGTRSTELGSVVAVTPLAQDSLIQYASKVEYVDENTYYCDRSLNTASGQILSCGGFCTDDEWAGLWYWRGSETWSTSSSTIGCRLCYKPQWSTTLPDSFNGLRNRLKCMVKNNSIALDRAGLTVFPLATTTTEAFYLQPDSWVDAETGDLTKDGNAKDLEYLNYPHPFKQNPVEELTSYTHINDLINTKAKREIGICCLQKEKPTNPRGQYNVWTDLKRVQIDTPAGPRVVQTQDAAKWDDTKFWVEGWDAETDTHMAQVKRHPQLTNKLLNIDCYMNNIDDLYTGLDTCTLSYKNGPDGNSGTWYLKKPNGPTYITLKVTQTQKQEGQS